MASYADFRDYERHRLAYPRRDHGIPQLTPLTAFQLWRAVVGAGNVAAVVRGLVPGADGARPDSGPRADLACWLADVADGLAADIHAAYAEDWRRGHARRAA